MSSPDCFEFSRGVYDIVKTIPRGRATSYGAIARALGHPGRSRMVGRVMAHCDDPTVPAHRVVNSQGILSGSGAFGSPSRMQELLEADGIPVRQNRIVRWKAVFWNPLTEIRI